MVNLTHPRNRNKKNNNNTNNTKPTQQQQQQQKSGAASDPASAPEGRRARKSVVRNPVAMQEVQQQLLNTLREINTESYALTQAKVFGFENCASADFIKQCRTSTSGTRSTSRFNPRTHVPELNAMDVQIMPLLNDMSLMCDYFYSQYTQQKDSTALQKLHQTIRENAVDVVPEVVYRGPNTGTMPWSSPTQTLMHSMSLIPLKTFIQGIGTIEHEQAWVGASDSERYTDQTEWLGHQHAGVNVERCLYMRSQSALGMLLTDDEVEAIADKYTGYVKHMVRDALYALRVREKYTAGGGDGADQAGQAPGESPAMELENVEDNHAGQADTGHVSGWPWASAPVRLMTRRRLFSPAEVHTQHGPVLTSHDQVQIHLGFDGTQDGVRINDVSEACMHMTASIDIVTRRFVPSRIQGEATMIGTLADADRQRTRYKLLSQQVTVKVAYGVHGVPSSANLEIQPVAFKITTANAGEMLPSYEIRRLPDYPIRAKRLGLVMHVIGGGMPLTVGIERLVNADQGNFVPNPFFTHGDLTAAFAPEALSFGLLVRYVRLIEELRCNPVYFRMALRPLGTILGASEVEPWIKNPNNIAEGGEKATDFERFQRASKTPVELLRVSSRGPLPAGVKLHAEFERVFRPTAINGNLTSVLPELLRAIVLNTASESDLAPESISRHTMGHVDGGVICVGPDGQDLRQDLSSLHITWTPVARPMDTVESHWNPGFKRIFVEYKKDGGSRLRVDAPSFVPISSEPERDGAGGRYFAASAEPFASIWGPPADGAHSPATNFSGYDDDESLRHLKFLSSQSSAFDQGLYINP